MTLSEKIAQDLTTAMKARDEARVSTLRMLKSAVHAAGIQKGKSSLEDGEVLEVIQRMLKQYQESVEAYTKGNRLDLAEKEKKEIEILRAYLPPAISEEELKSIIRATLQELKVSGASAVGQVMKAVIPKVKGRADGKLINQLVTQMLQAVHE